MENIENFLSQDLNQTLDAPFDDLETAQSYISQIKNLIEWNKIGILNDEFERNLIIILIKNEEIEAAFRTNLDAEKSTEFIWNLHQPDIFIEQRTLLGISISKENLDSLECILSVWKKSETTAVFIESIVQLKEFLEAQYRDKQKGRGKDFSVETIRRVWFDSHGYCMFQGCGQKLDYEQLTGNHGNFGYLAHNIAASELGKRGVKFTSGKLSDDPKNILLLCDKHHRLIDNVAAADYSAETLSEMRKNFVNLSAKLLEALSYEPIPVYTVLWPIGGHFISEPSEKEIASCMHLTKNTMQGSPKSIETNSNLYRRNPDHFNANIVEILKVEAEEIIQGIKHNGCKAALFAIGPMPALVGLGSLLGNKNEITPMLRHRQTSNWYWPSENVVQPFYKIEGLNVLTDAKDVVICVNFTNTSTILNEKANSLEQETGADIIEINALPNFLGNGAIPNPASGRLFSADMQKLFHDLKSQGKETIHLLVIASNAACVFLGQAIDLHHPKIIVYDFSKEGMIPRLVIRNDGQKNNIELP